MLELSEVVFKESIELLDFRESAEEEVEELGSFCLLDEALHVMLLADLEDVEVAVVLHVLVGLMDVLWVDCIES